MPEGEGMTRREFLGKASKIAAGGALLAGLSACGVKPEESVQDATPEDRSYERKVDLGNIQSYGISVADDSLGATDPNDPNIDYPRAVKDGALMTIGGANVRINYNGGIFNGDVTFLNMPEPEGELGVGDIIPRAYMVILEENCSVDLTNYAMTLKDSKRKDNVILKKDKTFCLIPMVVTGMSTSIIDPGNTVPEGFPIDGDNMMGATKGWLSWAVLQTSEKKNDDGTWGAQMMGVLENKSTSGIYINQASAPKLSATGA